MICTLIGVTNILLIATVVPALWRVRRFRRQAGLGWKRVQNVRVPARLKPRCVKKIERGFNRAARKSRTIVLLIDSKGGSCVATRAIIDLMNAHPGPIVVLVIGECKSGAALIACAVPVENRYILPGSRVMIHAAYAGKVYRDAHNTHTAKAWLRTVDNAEGGINGWMASYLEQTTRLSNTFLRQLFESGGDLYFDPERACDAGLMGTIIK